MSDALVEYYGSSGTNRRESKKQDPFKHLVDIYGTEAGVQKDYDCFRNAIHNAVLCIIDGTNQPAIFDVRTGVGRHAYLAMGKEARSKGYTWTNSYYPELSVDQIRRLHGQDVMLDLFVQALDPEKDRHGYHHVLDKLEKRFPDVHEIVSNYVQANKK